MEPILDKNLVLVLNRNWQAINIITPAQAFCQMCTDTATALDICGRETMIPIPWTDWLELPIRESDLKIHTVRGGIRVPTVIVLARYAKVPMSRPRFSARGIRERDMHRCQYTGRELAPGEGNIDHVVPRSRGGETSWTNCVLSAKTVNSRKGNRTPEEAGLKLLRPPVAPRAVPVTLTLTNALGIEDWHPFLG